MANDYSGLFTTPQELQANALNQLQKRQAAISGMGGSYDALLGQIAAGGGTTGAMMAQGIKSMFGLKSGEEMAAERTQERLKKAGNDYHGLMSLGKELMNEGDMKQAYAVMQLAKDMKPESTDPLKPQSTYGKIAVDEGFAVGTPDYVARVRQLHADDNKEDGVDITDTNDIKNIFAHAKFKFGCDARDPECFAKAEESYMNLRRADTAQQKMEVFGYEGLTKRTDEARAAASSIRTVNSALETLDKGGANIGSFPNTRQGADKLVGTLFGIQSAADQAAQTELLLAQTGTLAKELLQTGAFGEGTGISKVDLEAAQKLAGASNQLTPEGMRQILEYQAKMYMAKIQRHNERIKKYSPEFYARTPEGDVDMFYVTTPDLYKMKNVGVRKGPETVSYYDEKTDMMFDIPKGAVFGNNGTVYEFEGSYYNLDGTEIK